MAFKTIFKRYEYKYKITLEQKEALLRAMEPYMVIDQYGRTTIRNLYFDTDNYRLIRRSIEKPVYKEKLRVRSYEKANGDSTVFVELKKKYKHVVYKRRISLTEKTAMEWLCEGKPLEPSTQISREIDYFMKYYGDLAPKAFLSYEREAYRSRQENDDFRITFDENILYRQTELSLRHDAYGTPLLPEGTCLMEIKCSGGIPLWMTAALSELHIYRTSFSKYGTAYQTVLFEKQKEVALHV